MKANSTFSINTTQIKSNIKNILHDTPFIPVLKADAYGHGLIEIAKIIEEERNIEFIGVAQVSEAIRLLEAKITKRIILFCGITDDQIPTVIRYKLEPLIHDMHSLEALESFLKKDNIMDYPVHLKINTGLNRLGFWPEEELDLAINKLKNNPHFQIVSTYSHFIEGAKVDSELSKLQNKRYLKAIEKLELAKIPYGFKHICDSGAYEWFKEAHYDAVRIGRALYMDNPNLEESKRFKDVGTWHAQIIATRQLKKGDTVGYGASTVLEKDTVVGIINIGYGDGLSLDYPLLKAPILVNDKKTTVLSIAMDQSYIDITNLDVKVNDIVTLFGESESGHYLSSNESAQLMDDEGVTLTTLLSNRVARQYR